MLPGWKSACLALTLATAGVAPSQGADVAARLAAHPRLSSTKFARAESGAWQVFVQVAEPGASERQAEAVLADLRETLDPLGAAWRARVVQPLGLGDGAPAPSLAVVVLGSDSGYEELLAQVAPRTPASQSALWDPALGAVVTRTNPGKALAPERRNAVLRAAVGSWLDRTAGRPLLGPSALREGLAGRLVREASDSNLGAEPDRHDVRALVVAAGVEQRRLQTLPALGVLWSFPDAAAASEWVYDRARTLKLTEARTDEALELIYAQARTWYWFFEHGAQGRYRAGWHRYLAQALRGASGLEVLSAALGVKLPDLEREFLDVLATEHQRSTPAKKLPLDWIEALMSERAALPGPGPKEISRAPAATFEPSRLAPSAIDPNVQLALALVEARAGALNAALARLDASLVLVAATSDGARSTRERERLAALLAARDAWAQTSAAKGGRVMLERDGKKVSLKVERCEDGVLHFAKNRLDLASLALEELPPQLVLGDAKELPEGTPAWIPTYAKLLAGQVDASDLAALPGGEALSADGPDIEARLRAGAAALDLRALSELSLDPSGALSPADTQTGLDGLARLLAVRELPVVSAALDDLRAFARLALSSRHDALGGVPALAGKTSAGPAGSLRVHYEFDRPEEAQDFILVPGALPDWHASMTAVPKSLEDSYFIVRQGAFFGDGQVVYRHALAFTAPVRVRYQMRYVAREGDPLDVGVLMFGLGGNRKGMFAAASEFSDVYVTNPASGYSTRVLFEGERVITINTLYECEARLEVEGDGFVIEAWRDGNLRNQLPAPGCSGSEVFMFVHSPRIVALENLDIEGLPEPAVLAALRETWIERELTALGF
jgi:hypothetical protein